MMLAACIRRAVSAVVCC